MPLVDIFLRGAARLKDLQDGDSYILVLHLEESFISMIGFSLVCHTINPTLPSLEATVKNAMIDRMVTEGILAILIHRHQILQP